MKRLFLAILFSVSFSGMAYALEETLPTEQICSKLKESGLDSKQVTKRVCCSWHCDASGCSAGR